MRVKRKKLAKLMILCMLINLLAGIPVSFAGSTNPTVSADKTTLENGVAQQEAIVTLENDTFKTDVASNGYSVSINKGGSAYLEVTYVDPTHIKLTFEQALPACEIYFSINQYGLESGKIPSNIQFTVPENNEPLNFESLELPEAGRCAPYSYKIPVIGGSGAKYFVTTGAAILPEGINLSSNGVLFGEPTRTGTTDIEVAVQDCSDVPKVTKATFKFVVNDGFRTEDGFTVSNGYVIRYNGESRDITVPSEVNGKPVTGIARAAFAAYHGESNSQITSIAIPEGVKVIGHSAFAECTQLKAVYIPATMETIEISAFFNCRSLEAVFFEGNAPKQLGATAFYNMGNMSTQKMKLYYKEGATGFDTAAWQVYAGNLVAYNPADKYEIKYVSNTDSGNTPKTETDKSVGDKITIADDKDLTKAGYSFVSWNTKADGTGSNYYSGARFTVVPENITLYAQWKKVFNVSVDANIKNGTIKILAFDEGVSNAEAVEVKTAYKGMLLMVNVEPKEGYRFKRDSLTINGKKYNNNEFDGPSLPMEAMSILKIEKPDTGVKINKNIIDDGPIGLPIGGANRTRSTIVFPMIDEDVVVSAEFVEATSDYELVSMDPKNPNICGIVTYYGNSKVVSIPKTEGEKVITTIFPMAFAANVNMEHLIIPETVTNLAPYILGMQSNCKSVFFSGDAPRVGDSFGRTSKEFTIYHLDGKTGFDSKQFSKYKVVALKAEELVAKDKEMLKWAIIQGKNTDATAVKTNLILPVVAPYFESSISWTSSNPQVISATGTVTRPASADAEVTLTAVISNRGVTQTETIVVKVAKQDSTSTGGTGTTERPERGDSTGQGSTSGGATPTPIQPTIPKPSQPITPVPSVLKNNIFVATTNVDAKTDASGKSVATVTELQVKEAVKKATEEANKLGKNAAARVEITVSGALDSKYIETTLPKGALTELTGVQMDALKMTTPIASLTFNKKGLGVLSRGATDDIKVIVSRLDAAGFNKETQTLIGDRPVLSLGVSSANTTVPKFSEMIEVSVPYKLKAGEDKNAITVFGIDEKGKTEAVKRSYFDERTGTVTFIANANSQYAVGYNKLEFKDVNKNSDYYNAITFMTARGISAGMGENAFEPSGKLTRAQFVTLLMKAYDVKTEATTTDNFADAGQTYYTKYLAVAKQMKLTSGVGANKFAPEKEISTQEMMVLLYNMLNVLGQLPTETSDKKLTDYSDANQVAKWAQEAMNHFVATGTLEVKGENINATQDATRADMAKALYNLLSK